MSAVPLNPAVLEALRHVAGADQVLTDPADCWPYGYDNSRRHALPQAVVFATTHEQVRDIVRLCHQHEVPLVARGRGTGTTGATVPLYGGVVLALERMDRILVVDPANRVMVVEPGVTNQAVQDAAAQHGFFWPPDPTSAAFCSVGGNLAYNSAGPRAVKYGTPRENTLGLRAVTGSGAEIRTGVYTTKGVVGYDLTRLLIGSEGTLAIITEATLKLTPLPETRRTLQAAYADMHGAARAVSRIMAQAVTPCALEFIDGRAIEMIRAYAQAPLPSGAGAMLMIEVDGQHAAIDAAADSVARAAQGQGLLEIIAARGKEETAALWATRKALSPALRTIAPKKINEDVVVPVSRMAELIGGLEQLAREFAITIVNFGHAGNGNIHVNLLVNPDDPAEMARAEHCLDRVFDLVLKLQGTLSGEHGVGIEKRDFVAREIEPETLELMRAIKRLFDPRAILNPGKMFPAEK
ncbi:MAG: FAD-linked oxidase C-terminal domain-containing protein [Pseudomonadota bacterium]